MCVGNGGREIRTVNMWLDRSEETNRRVFLPQMSTVLLQNSPNLRSQLTAQRDRHRSSSRTSACVPLRINQTVFSHALFHPVLMELRRHVGWLPFIEFC